MKSSKTQFEQELYDPSGRRTNIIFIGMSGSGKTHWARLLAQEFEYEHIEFDNLIGNSDGLAELIKGFPGKDKAEKMGNYFGMPWDAGFESKERIFLDIEKKFMSQQYGPGVIIDLTGSCISHPGQMESISNSGIVIYLETSQEKQREMFQIFMKNPKPVCWGGVFSKKAAETNEQALERSFPLLLKHRANLYQQFANVTLPYAAHKNATNPGEFIKQVTTRLS